MYVYAFPFRHCNTYGLLERGVSGLINDAPDNCIVLADLLSGKVRGRTGVVLGSEAVFDGDSFSLVK